MVPSLCFHVVFLVALLSRLATAGTNGSQLACQLLTRGPISSIVDLPSGELYDTGARSAWNLENTQLNPACIVFARTTKDVSIAMTAIYQFKARYAVQAGGHSAMQGWNNVEGGVLIHLMNMNAISYNASTSSVTFQPGLKWGEVLDALEPHGVAVAGGRLSTVGTGLLLGGGISYLAPQVGYSADTMREIDVVLVTGQIVTAAANNKYADLFRALKGGANRFGIVTRYVVDAIPTGTKDDKNWFGGQLIYANSSVDAVLTALAHYALKVDDPKASMLLYFFSTFENGVISPLIILNAFYKGSELPEKVFGEFLAIPAIQTDLAPRSYYDAANFIGSDAGNPPMIEFFGASVLEGSDDIKPYREIYALYAELYTNFKHELGGSTLSFTAVSNSQIKVGRSRGGNAIDAARGGFNVIQFGLSLPAGVQTTSSALDVARQDLFRVVPRTPGLPLYVAESDKNQQVFATYGGYDFLKETYKKYDPTRDVQHISF